MKNELNLNVIRNWEKAKADVEKNGRKYCEIIRLICPADYPLAVKGSKCSFCKLYKMADRYKQDSRAIMKKNNINIWESEKE